MIVLYLAIINKERARWAQGVKSMISDTDQSYHMICPGVALTQGYMESCPLAICCQPALASLRFSRQRYNLPLPL